MDITAVLILITTGEEMKKKNTGISVKELQLEHNLATEFADCLSRFSRVKDVSMKTVQKGLL